MNEQAYILPIFSIYFSMVFYSIIQRNLSENCHEFKSCNSHFSCMINLYHIYTISSKHKKENSPETESFK